MKIIPTFNPEFSPETTLKVFSQMLPRLDKLIANGERAVSALIEEDDKLHQQLDENAQKRLRILGNINAAAIAKAKLAELAGV